MQICDADPDILECGRDRIDADAWTGEAVHQGPPARFPALVGSTDLREQAGGWGLELTGSKGAARIDIGISDKDRARMIGTIQENIRRFVNGMPLLNVVDKQKGY